MRHRSTDPVAVRTGKTVAVVLSHVAFEMRHEIADIQGPCKKRRLTWARFATAWLARKHTVKTHCQIGKVLGGRDASTICWSVRRAEELRARDEYFRWLTDHLDTLLGAA